MLFYLISWVLLLVSGAAVGCVILVVTKSSVFANFGDRMITATWLGLLTIASVLLGVSLVLPLSPAVGFGVAVLLTTGALFIKGVRQNLRISFQYLTIPAAVGVGILAVISAFGSTRLVEAYDTGFYHYQLTSWLAEYGTIRGLALLHIVLGYSSSWFALAAPFDFGPFQGRIAGLLGGLAIFLCLSHFALAVSRIIQRRAERADWFLVGGYIVIFCVCLGWAFEVSLSPDVPSWILTFLAGWLILITGHSAKRTTPEDDSAILPLIVAFGAAAIKLSAGPVLVIAALFYWLNSSAKWNVRFVAACVAGLLLIPKAATGAVSSGCPFFPNPVLCLDVPWGMGPAMARFASESIRDFARWSGPMPPSANSWNWMLPWISHVDKLALVLFCAACLLGFVAARGWRASDSLRYVLALALLGSVFLFMTAPNPRFGAGYLALYPALFLAALGPEVENRLPLRPMSQGRIRASSIPLAYVLVGLAGLVAIDAGLREFKLRRELRSLTNVHLPADATLMRRLLLPPALARSEGDLVIVKNRRFDLLESLDIITEHSNGIEYHRPRESDQCWGVAIPCTPRPLEGEVMLRSPADGLRSGFTRSGSLDSLLRKYGNIPEQGLGDSLVRTRH
jgi:hypothetical protein